MSFFFFGHFFGTFFVLLHFLFFFIFCSSSFFVWRVEDFLAGLGLGLGSMQWAHDVCLCSCVLGYFRSLTIASRLFSLC